MTIIHWDAALKKQSFQKPRHPNTPRARRVGGFFCHVIKVKTLFLAPASNTMCSAHRHTRAVHCLPYQFCLLTLPALPALPALPTSGVPSSCYYDCYDYYHYFHKYIENILNVYIDVQHTKEHVHIYKYSQI